MPPLAVAIGVFLLIVQHARFSEVGRGLVTSVAYCIVIGIPSAIVLNWAGWRYSERYPRLIVLINAAILVVTGTLGCLAAGLLFVVVGIEPRSWYWREVTGSYASCIVITLTAGLSISAFETMRHRLQAATIAMRTKQAEQERAYKRLAEARLSSLASRIHPHFLFNTLNSIASLIPSDPKRAEDPVGKLAAVLRFSLNGNQTGLVPLSQELKIVRDYLDIERTRFGQRLRYTVEVPADLMEIKVPPLALQTLVENSIKHVAAQRAEGAVIRVSASAKGQRAHLEVTDDGPGFTLDAITPEHGLGNVESRLELLFGERAQLSVTRVNENTAVSLQFPVE
jgi:LytS/YehU family sensor histidine kinase